MSRLGWGAALALLCSCAARPHLAPSLREALRATPSGYLSGTLVELGAPQVLDDRDFAYALAFSPDGTLLAFTHLGARHSRLSLARLESRERLATVEVNPNEFDLEDVAFAPDGKAVAVVSRDGTVRAYSAGALRPLAAYQADEPLVSLAFHPGGRFLVVGSARGLLTALEWPSLRFASEQRAHRDAVAGLVFAPGGRLYSGGWDRALVELEVADELTQVSSARVAFSGEGQARMVRLGINGAVVAPFVFDQRLGQSVVSRSLAAALGVEGKETVTLPTALGAVEAPLLRGVTLEVKGLRLEGLALAVCDACLPKGMEAALGEPFFARVQLAFDETNREAVLTAKEPGPPSRWIRFTEQRRAVLPGPLNDLTVDARGAALGVALSTRPPIRDREVYERERKGRPLEDGPADLAATFDLSAFQLVRSFPEHVGPVVTAALAPDGGALFSGGWDKELHVDAARLSRRFGWILRKVRLSADGRHAAVAAWTPQNAVGDQRSAPSVVVYELVYAPPSSRVVPR